MMKQYLMIENPGAVESIDFITILGLSSSRNSQTKNEEGISSIGQFGSGWNYSIATTLRNNLDLRMFSGKNGYKFVVEDRESKDISDKSIFIKEIVLKQIAGDSKKSKAMGFDVRFGELDWTNIGMAIREFISNALDACVALNRSKYHTVIEFVSENQVRARSGYTRLFIEANNEVIKYIEDLKTNFIVFRSDYDPNVKIIKKGTISPCRVYRRGVLVGTSTNSLYDYNFDTIDLKESRNVNESVLLNSISESLINNASEEIINNILDKRFKDDVVEVDILNRYRISIFNLVNNKNYDVWQKAFKNYFRERVICSNTHEVDRISHKGYETIWVNSDNIRSMSKAFRCCMADNYLNMSDSIDRKLEELSENDRKKVERLWDILSSLSVTMGKSMPDIETFINIMNGGSTIQGYYDESRKMVGLNKDMIRSDKTSQFIQVTIEEFAHYITKARDCSRDLQDWAFRTIAELILLHYS